MYPLLYIIKAAIPIAPGSVTVCIQHHAESKGHSVEAIHHSSIGMKYLLPGCLEISLQGVCVLFNDCDRQTCLCVLGECPCLSIFIM